MSTSFDWPELIKDKKGVVTKDNQTCGNIIGEDKENIIIEEGAINTHIYKVPKSTVGGYNGAELTLNLQYNELETYEEKEEGKDKGKEEGGSFTESIKSKVSSLKEKTTDKAKDVKEKTVDKATDMTDQEESKSEGSRDIGHADNVQYPTTGGETHGQDQRETNASDMQTSTKTSTYTGSSHEAESGKNKNETNRNVDTGKQSDESATNVESSFTCETCDAKFQSRQELKEHSATKH